MRRPELTPARSRSRRAHHADATRRRLIGGSRLRRLGFKGSGARFELPSTTHWLVLGVQKSLSSNATGIRFTVNLKAVSRARWEVVREENSWARDKPDGNSLGGTDHTRLGLLAFGTDTWWEVDPVEPVDNVVDSIVQLVEAFAVPWLREREADE